MFEEYKIKQLLSPSNLFKSIEEVKDFLEISATVKDLQCFLDVCEEEELYEYCLIINNKIINQTEAQHR